MGISGGSLGKHIGFWVWITGWHKLPTARKVVQAFLKNMQFVYRFKGNLKKQSLSTRHISPDRTFFDHKYVYQLKGVFMGQSQTVCTAFFWLYFKRNFNSCLGLARHCNMYIQYGQLLYFSLDWDFILLLKVVKNYFLK